MGCFQVMYDSRVVNYECKLFIRLATGLVYMEGDSCQRSCEFESQCRSDRVVCYFRHQLPIFYQYALES